jgi:hypothetical protein
MTKLVWSKTHAVPKNLPDRNATTHHKKHRLLHAANIASSRKEFLGGDSGLFFIQNGLVGMWHRYRRGREVRASCAALSHGRWVSSIG